MFPFLAASNGSNLVPTFAAGENQVPLLSSKKPMRHRPTICISVYGNQQAIFKPTKQKDVDEEVAMAAFHRRDMMVTKNIPIYALQTKSSHHHSGAALPDQYHCYDSVL
ncbi:unnamed protein product [Victoria cruziana]